MRKRRKILFTIVLILVLIPATAVLVIQIPHVQTIICQKVLNVLGQNYDGEITLDKVYYAVPDRLIIKNITIKDTAGDTLSSIGRVSVAVNVPKFLKKKEIIVNRAGISDGCFNLITNEDGTSNLNDLLKIFGPGKEKDTTSSLPPVNIKYFSIENFAFSMVNRSNPVRISDKPVKSVRSVGSVAMDFRDLHISDINLTARKVKFEDGLLSLDLDKFQAKESRGFDLKNLTGTVTYSPEGVRIDNLSIIDNYSDIEANYLSLGFDSPADFSDFLNKITLGADFTDTRFDFRTLHFFSPALDFLTMCLTLNGEIKGQVANFQTDNLCVKTESGATDLDFNAHISGLPDIMQTMVGFHIKECTTTTSDIEYIINGCTPKGIKKGTVANILPYEQISFTGSLDGFFTDFVAFGALDTKSSGTIDVDAIMRTDEQTRNYEIIGNFSGKEIALGKIAKSEKIGNLTFDGSIAGSAGPAGNNLSLDNLTVRELLFNDYNYTNIIATGNLNDSEFNGRIKSEDPNLDFDFHGVAGIPRKGEDALYKFTIDLNNADLYALHFDKREIAKIKMNAEADFTRNSKNDFFGDFTIKNFSTELADGKTDIGEISIASFWSDNNYSMNIKSSLLNADFQGNNAPSDFISDITAALVTNELPNLTQSQSVLIASDHNYKFKLTTGDLRPICNFFVPGLYIIDGTTIYASVKDARAEAGIESGLIAFKENYLRDLDVAIQNETGTTDIIINAESIQSGKIISPKNTIYASVKNDIIDFAINLMNDSTSVNNLNINGQVAFPDRNTSTNLFTAKIIPSEFTLNNEKWSISPAAINYREKHIEIEDFAIVKEKQSLRLEGTLSDSPKDTVRFQAKQFDIGIINTLLSNSVSFGGEISGEGALFGYLGERKGLLLNLNGEDLAFSGKEFGDLTISSNWVDREKSFDFSLENKLGEERPIMLTGSFRPEDKYLNVNARLNKFDVSYFNSLAAGIVSDLNGTISTTVRAQGNLDNLKITSRNNRVNNLGFVLDYTKVPYILDGSFDLSEDGFSLKEATIKDLYGNMGMASGGLTMDHLSNPQLDLKLVLEQMHGLDTGPSDNESFYGKAFASGIVTLKGPFSKINLDIDITTEENSNVHIPLGSATAQKGSMLTFTNSLHEISSAYDSLITLNASQKSAGDMFVHVRIDANTLAEINLDINESSGDAIKARGNGVIDINVAPELFEIKGDYSLTEGSYKLVLLGLASRDFSISPGGTINFNGDIMQSDLNLTANYRTKASMSTLVPDMTTRRNVDCNIGITGKLANPELSFDIEIPDLDPTTQSIVESTMNTEEKRLKQMLTLLISGGFMPDEQSGIVNNTTVLFSNASEIMSNQINNVFRQLEIPLDLGFNYQPGENGRDIFDVAVSTQLFNNRVTINGNIGNSQMLGASKNDIVGDVDMEIKLSKSGKIRLTLFSHSADQYSTYLDQSQRNGAGIAYQEEFDTFAELWQKIIRGKAKPEATVIETQSLAEEEHRLYFIK